MAHMPLDASVMAAVDTSQQATGNVGTAPPTPSGSRPGPRWFVVSTYPQAERRALDHLQQQGYQAYLPLCTIRRRDRVLRTLFHPVEVPLFPSYAFVSFDPQHDPWRPIVNTLGVYALLRRPDGIPNPVARGAVEALQAAQALAAPREAPDAPWRVGDVAAPASWHFAGLKGVIVEIRGKRAILAIMMGDKGFLTRLSVDVANLVARDA
jgi:transcriptional antiterminator RfaH